MESNQSCITESSLQYMDDSEEGEDRINNDGYDSERIRLNRCDQISNANSGSYGSKNEATTLPMSQK